MSEIKKRNSQYAKVGNGRIQKQDQDIFEQFEKGRKILKDSKQKKQVDKLIFKTKTNANEIDNLQNEYEDDFDQIDNKQQNKNKRQGQHSQKKMLSKNQSLKIPKQSRTKQLKLVQRNRSVKSALDQQNDGSIQAGKYLAEVQKKFEHINTQSITNDGINRANEQIKDYIKKYNDILTDIINKNLVQLGNKKKKPMTAEELLKITQEEIKNNQKIEQMDLVQLKKLEGYKIKLQQQENYNEKTIQQQIFDLQSTLKQKRKDIYNLKLSVENESKKLLPTSTNQAKNQNHSDVTALKEKLANMKKQFEKYNQKISHLQSRQSQLTTKVESLGGVDKQASQMKSTQKQVQDKKKKYSETKKKYDDLKSHVSKTDALWSTKCTVAAHQNESIKQKIKNVDLQIKNMEESIKQAYEKSMMILTNSKPKNELNIKALERIKAQMNQNNEYKQKSLNNKQMSLSQMKILTKKKHSTDNFSINTAQIALQREKQGQMEKQGKIKSQQGERNRVWKEQNAKLEQNKLKQRENQNSKKNLEKGSEHSITGESKTMNLKSKNRQSQSTLQKEGTIHQQEQKKEQSKPKKFNFGRNKTNSEIKLTPNTQQPKQQIVKANEQLMPIKQKEQKQNEQDQIIKPKRFNLLRRSKQQNSGYSPSIQNHQSDPAKIDKKQTDKPLLNLKIKRDGENKYIPDNQFMKQ